MVLRSSIRCMLNSEVHQYILHQQDIIYLSTKGEKQYHIYLKRNKWFLFTFHPVLAQTNFISLSQYVEEYSHENLKYFLLIFITTLKTLLIKLSTYSFFRAMIKVKVDRFIDPYFMLCPKLFKNIAIDSSMNTCLVLHNPLVSCKT